MEETLSVKNWSHTFISIDMNIGSILSTQNISLGSHFLRVFFPLDICKQLNLSKTLGHTDIQNR